jgi:hypothetical protein
MLKFLVRWYKDEDSTDSVSGADLIVPLSYTTLRDRLTNGTHQGIMRAFVYARQLPQATLAFSNASHAFPGSERVEYFAKKLYLLGIPHICAASCINSVQEAENIKAALPFSPKKILIVCGEVHSRSARIIWRQVFPDAEIRISCMPFAYEYQRDFPFFVERYAWIWFAASLAREVLLRTLGPERMRALKHNASA